MAVFHINLMHVIPQGAHEKHFAVSISAMSFSFGGVIGVGGSMCANDSSLGITANDSAVLYPQRKSDLKLLKICADA